MSVLSLGDIRGWDLPPGARPLSPWQREALEIKREEARKNLEKKRRAWGSEQVRTSDMGLKKFLAREKAIRDSETKSNTAKVIMIGSVGVLVAAVIFRKMTA